jgi:deoxyribodipyrimidine photolyase
VIHRPSDRLPNGYPAPIVDLKASREEALAALRSIAPEKG